MSNMHTTTRHGSRWRYRFFAMTVLAGCLLLIVSHALADPRVIICIFKWEQAPDFAGGAGVYMIVTDKTVVVSDHELDRPLSEQKTARSFHFDRPADDWKCGDPHKVEGRDMIVRRCARLVSRAANSFVMDFKNRVVDSLGYGGEAEIEFHVDLSGTCTAHLLKANKNRVPIPFRDMPEGGRIGPMKVKQETCQFVTK